MSAGTFCDSLDPISRVWRDDAVYPGTVFPEKKRNHADNYRRTGGARAGITAVRSPEKNRSGC